MKIILTGCSGFLGGHVLRSLLSNNHQIILVNRNSEVDISSVNILGQYTSSKESLNKIFEDHNDIDCILHCATNYGNNLTSTYGVFADNLIFPMMLLELCQINGCKRFINFDTFFSQYFDHYDYLVSYSTSKNQFMQWGRIISNSSSVKFINMRIFHLYGPGDSSNKFIPSTINKLILNEPIFLGPCLNKRDFIYISDVLSALNLILKNDITSSSNFIEYDVGTGSSFSIKYFVETAKNIISSKSELHFNCLPERVGEPMNCVADTSRLKSLMWSSIVCLDMGIRSIYIDILNKLGQKT